MLVMGKVSLKQCAPLTLASSCRKVTGALKAVHDKYAKALGEREEYQAEFQEAILYNDQIGGLLNKVPISCCLLQHSAQRRDICRGSD